MFVSLETPKPCRSRRWETLARLLREATILNRVFMVLYKSSVVRSLWDDGDLLDRTVAHSLVVVVRRLDLSPLVLLCSAGLLAMRGLSSPRVLASFSFSQNEWIGTFYISKDDSRDTSILMKLSDTGPINLRHWEPAPKLKVWL